MIARKECSALKRSGILRGKGTKSLAPMPRAIVARSACFLCWMCLFAIEILAAEQTFKEHKVDTFDPWPEQTLADYKVANFLVMEKPLKIGPIEQNANTMSCGKRFELSFPLEGSYDNPFDQKQLTVDCLFTIPGGKTIRLPAFFYTPFDTKEGLRSNRLLPMWKVRFTPRQPGTYTWRIIAQNLGKESRSKRGRVTVLPGEYQGFVRISEKQPIAFEYDNGRAIHPVGPNIHIWTPPYLSLVPERVSYPINLLNRLGKLGANFVRLRMDFFYLPIEYRANVNGKFLGPGWFQQEACWDVDRLLATANTNGITVMMCLYNGNPGGLGFNSRNMFLKRNGGPVESPEEFWVDPKVRALVKNKLRYVVARWGHLPNLFAWEFFNESHLNKTIASWYNDMTDYLSAIDPYDHIITSSNYPKENIRPDPEVEKFEIFNYHHYGALNMPVLLAERQRLHHGWKKMPVIVGEWGLSAHRIGHKLIKDSENGVGHHNALWAGAVNGFSISEWYVEQLDNAKSFQVQYPPHVKWIADIAFNHPERRLLEVAVKSVKGKPGNADRIIAPGGFPLFKDFDFENTTFTVDPETPDMTGLARRLKTFLHGKEKKGRDVQPVFELNCANPFEFQVLITRIIRDSLVMKLWLDNKLLKQVPLGSASVHEPPIVVGIKVPAGKHAIRVGMDGKDRALVAYRIRNYFTGPPTAHAYGFQTGNAAYIWMVNENSTAIAERVDIVPGKIDSAVLGIKGLDDGTYRVEWYDTWRGTVVSKDSIICREGILVLNSPAFHRDIACKVTLQ